VGVCMHHVFMCQQSYEITLNFAYAKVCGYRVRFVYVYVCVWCELWYAVCVCV